MSTLFVIPSAFTVVNGNADANNPLTNMGLDHPSLVWRSANLTTVYAIVDLGASPNYDTVAVIGSNLRSTDTVRVRTGTTNTGVGSYDSGTVAAYAGNKSDLVSTKSIVSVGNRTERYIRIDITATAHPDGYVEAQRLVIGQAITTQGMDSDAEQGFEDKSVSNAYPGGEVYDLYAVVPSWKFSVDWVSEVMWRDYFIPLLLYAGSSNAILFIPDDENPSWQHEVIFGRFSSIGKGKHRTYDMWKVEGAITALAP